MSSDETVRKAARVMARAYFGEPVEQDDMECSTEWARALDSAGLLAPSPLREEWATRFPDGHLCPGKGRDYDLWFKGDPPKGVNVRRYVSDWEPIVNVDRHSVNEENP